MSWAATVVGVAGLGLSAYEYYQSDQDKKKAQSEQDQYKIPSEITQNLSDANRNAMKGMSSQEANNFATQVYKGQTYANQTAKDLHSGLVGTAQANDSANNAFLQFAGADSAIQRENQKTLYGQRQNVADYRDQQWNINSYQPYIYDRNRASSEQSAALQNGIQGASALGYGLTKSYNSPSPDGSPSNIPSKEYFGGQQKVIQGTSPYSKGYDPTFDGVSNQNYSPYYNPNYNQSPFVLQDAGKYTTPYQ